MCEDAFRFPAADRLARLSREPRITIAAWCVVHGHLVNMALAEVTHHGRKLDLRYTKCAFVQRRAGEGIEKGFLTMILDAEGTAVLMIGAREGLSLLNAACCIAVHTKGHLEHLVFCA